MSANEMTVESLLRAHAPLAPESLRSRVLAVEPRRTPSRRLVLVVAVALVVAIAAAVVDGLTSSSGTTPTAAPQPLAAAATGGGGATAKSPPFRAALPSVAGAATRLQQTDASLDLRVGDASRAASRATRIATSLGGYAQSVHYDSAAGTAALVLRVPVQNAKTAVARLAQLGTVVSQNLSVTDLQHALQTETAQIAQLHRTIAALESALRNPSLPDAQRVILQIRLANAKRLLAERLHARTGTIAAGTTARIDLRLEKQGAVVPVPHPRGRLGRMVHSAVGFLGLEATAALYLLIVISPFALAAALAWSLREARRRQRERLVME